MNAVVAPGTRSTFVTTVAWIGILVGLYGLLMVGMQAFTFTWMSRIPGFARMLEHPPAGPPGMGLVVFRHWDVILPVSLASCILTLGASIGLLLREPWARPLFIFVVVASIVFSIANALYAAWTYLSPATSAAEGMKGTAASFIVAAFGGIAIVGVVVTIAFSIGLAWVVRRLMAPNVRAEFERRGAGA